MVERSLSSDLKKFLQNTSVRGIPRIINAKSRTQSIVWLLGIICCTCILLWQLSIMTTRFLSYPVSTSYSTSPGWDYTTFPDVTICNLCPLVFEKDFNLSYTDYVNTITAEFVESDERFRNVSLLYNNDPNQINATFKAVLASLVTLPGYFRNFPVLNNVADSGPVLGCSYFNWDYTPTNTYQCLANIKLIQNPDFYRCYTFTLNNISRKSIRGLSAIIYVEDYFDTLANLYNVDLRYIRASGFQVRISPPGGNPDMKWGFPVTPGVSTTVLLDQTLQTNLPYPYTNCTTQPTLGAMDAVTTYRQSYCTDVCVQSKILEVCGCLSTDRKFTSGQLNMSDNIVCGNVYKNSVNGSIDWIGIKQMLCVNSLSYYQSICLNKCAVPCLQFLYNPTISSAQWPHMFAQPSFYEAFIDVSTPTGTFEIPDDVKKMLIQYKEVLGYTKSVDKNLTAARELLAQLDSKELFKKNFVQLNLQFATNTYNVQTDMPAYSFDAFGAQIGGVLCLWLGLTIMFIFELLELVINILYHCFKWSRRHKTVTEEGSNKV